MKYSEGFRNSILKRVLPPNNQSVYSVAKEYGISPITVRSWLSKLKDGTLQMNNEGPDPNPNECGVTEKFKLLLESKSLDDKPRGEWIRQHGLHSEHPALWERELEGVMTNKPQDLRCENVELKKENRKLKKERERDKAAMAEAPALLTLKKKSMHIWTRKRRTHNFRSQAPDSRLD